MQTPKKKMMYVARRKVMIFSRSDNSEAASLRLQIRMVFFAITAPLRSLREILINMRKIKCTQVKAKI